MSQNSMWLNYRLHNATVFTDSFHFGYLFRWYNIPNNNNVLFHHPVWVRFKHIAVVYWIFKKQSQFSFMNLGFLFHIWIYFSWKGKIVIAAPGMVPCTQWRLNKYLSLLKLEERWSVFCTICWIRTILLAKNHKYLVQYLSLRQFLKMIILQEA